MHAISCGLSPRTSAPRQKRARQTRVRAFRPPGSFNDLLKQVRIGAGHGQAISCDLMPFVPIISSPWLLAGSGRYAACARRWRQLARDRVPSSGPVCRAGGWGGCQRDVVEHGLPEDLLDDVQPASSTCTALVYAQSPSCPPSTRWCHAMSQGGGQDAGVFPRQKRDAGGKTGEGHRPQRRELGHRGAVPGHEVSGKRACYMKTFPGD